MGLINLLNVSPSSSVLITEGVKFALQMFSQMAKMSGASPDEIKAVFDESYENLKRLDPNDLPDL